MQNGILYQFAEPDSVSRSARNWRVADSGRTHLLRIFIYTDVRGEGVKTRLCSAAARQPKQGCAVRQVPIDMWEWVWE